MDFSELLEKRRTIRDFEDKEVALEVLEEIIQDAIQAPNGGNRQPWKFVIVNSREQIKRFSDESKKNILATVEADPDHYMKRYEQALKGDAFNVFYNAPALIFIVGVPGDGSTVEDVGLLAAYMMLSATNRGLGTSWIGLGSRIHDPEIRAELNIPDGASVIAPIIIGYPKSIPAMPPRNAPDILKVLE